jgi:LuxR family maltose regulon positive regulatory protein
VILSDDERKCALGCIAAVGVYENLTKLDIDGVILSAQEAMDLLPDKHYMHSIAALGLGEAYSMLGDHHAAIQAFRKASGLSQRHGYRSLSVSTTCFMGNEQARLGDLKRADDTFRKAMSLAIEPGGRQLLAAGFPMVQLGDLMREWNDLSSAGLKIEQGVELCSRWGHPGFLMKGYLALIRLRLAQQDWDGMAEVLEKANHLAGKAGLDPETTGCLDDWQVRYWMGIGDVGTAVHWMEVSRAKQAGELRFYQHFIEFLNQTWVLVHSGVRLNNNTNLAQAPNLLDRLQSQIGPDRWLVERIKIQILRAVVYKALGDSKGAQKAFSTALNLGEPGGYIRTFLDEGEPIRELLHHAAADGTTSDYAKRLYLAYGQDESRYPAEKATAISDSVLLPPGRLVEPLSQRELEVMRLLASNLNSTEIAAELYISVSTVRTHIKNIYSKLDVHRRFEAVQKGHDLGLL